MEYIDAPAGYQREFVSDAKTALGLTWEQLAHALGVHRQMVFFYANETCRLQLQHYLFLCKRIKRKPDRLPIVSISNKFKKIHLPNMSEDLAELLGIIAGDGHLSEHTYELCISLDRTADKDYAPYVVSLLHKLFKTPATISYQNNVTRIKIYSKQLFDFLSIQHQAPVGNKRNIHRIPHTVLENATYLAAFIRGLFDADGSIHRHRPTDAAVEITSADKRFVCEIHTALTKLGIRASKSTRQVFVYSKQNIHLFFHIVGSSNPKNLAKYAHFSMHGTVPLVGRYIYKAPIAQNL